MFLFQETMLLVELSGIIDSNWAAKCGSKCKLVVRILNISDSQITPLVFVGFNYLSILNFMGNWAKLLLQFE